MNILSINFISMLMVSGLMITRYRSRKTFHRARVLLTEKIRKRGRS
jgi:hypothetical protein